MKIFASDISDKGLASKISKYSYNSILNTQKYSKMNKGIDVLPKTV